MVSVINGKEDHISLTEKVIATGVLAERDKEKVRELLSKGMSNRVELLVFTQEFECDFCSETRQIAEELASLNNKIVVQLHDFIADKEVADANGIDKIPALVVSSGGGNGVRYFGIPSGYEFSSLLEDIIDVSRGSARLPSSVEEAVRKIDKDVHIQVFVTPTCPYCPRAVRIAHQMAMVNSRIRADMVESIEFPQLANRYGVMAVPKIVINETHSFEGSLPEEGFLEQVLKALA